MSAIELLPCPFCGSEAASVPDPNHSTGWDVGCFSGTCEIEPHVWAVHHATAIDQWNRRTDLSQASVAAALEAAANAAWLAGPSQDLAQEELSDIGKERRDMAMRCEAVIRALITPAQHDALAAHVAAEVAKARAEAYIDGYGAAVSDVEAMRASDGLLRGQSLIVSGLKISLTKMTAQIGAKP